jgi:hypothetical protein
MGVMDDQQQQGFQWIERTLTEMAATTGDTIDRIFCEPAPRGGFVVVAYVNGARRWIDVTATRLEDLPADGPGDLHQMQVNLRRCFFESAERKT